MDTINIELTIQELDLIWIWLGKLPYENSVELINKLVKAYSEYINKKNNDDNDNDSI